MRKLLLVSTVALLAGCDQLNQIGETKRAPVSPPGIATPDEVSSAGERATPATPPANAAPATQPAPENPNTSPVPVTPPTANNAAPAAPAPGSKSIIGRTTDQVFDKRKILAEHPNLTVTPNKISTENPAAIPGQVYTRAVNVAGTADLVQWMKQEKVLNDRYPTHDQLVAYIKQHNIKLPVLPGNQLYAYDQEKGEIVVLQEP